MTWDDRLAAAFDSLEYGWRRLWDGTLIYAIFGVFTLARATGAAFAGSWVWVLIFAVLTCLHADLWRANTLGRLRREQVFETMMKDE